MKVNLYLHNKLREFCIFFSLHNANRIKFKINIQKLTHIIILSLQAYSNNITFERCVVILIIVPTKKTYTVVILNDVKVNYLKLILVVEMHFFIEHFVFDSVFPLDTWAIDNFFLTKRMIFHYMYFNTWKWSGSAID